MNESNVYVQVQWKGLVALKDIHFDEKGNSDVAVKRDALGRVLAYNKEGKYIGRFAEHPNDINQDCRDYDTVMKQIWVDSLTLNEEAGDRTLYPVKQNGDKK